MDWHDAFEHPDLLRTRSALIDASQTMLNLALGPADTMNSITGPAITKLEVARTLDYLGVPRAVPVREEISVRELAGKLSVSEVLLHRQLRFAYLVGMFHEPREGFVAHTSLSAALPDFSPWLQLRLSPLFTDGVYKVPEALATSPVKIPCQLADPKQRDMWQILEQDYPGDFFGTGMKSLMSGLLGRSLTPYIHGFDWQSLGPGTVIDVGGGNGHVEAHLIKEITNLNFIVQDLPVNAGPFKALFDQDAVQDKVKFQAHDFFQAQPPHSVPPKAYLLSRILHDWQDDDCVEILRHLLPTMESFGTKLFVCERVLPDRCSDLPNHVEQQLRTQDLLMFTLFGGGERSRSDWAELFKKADPRLAIECVKQPLDSVFSFMELVIVPGN